MDNPTNTEERVIVRLDASVYEKLDRKMSQLVVNQTTTELQAGYQLGVQAVLRELRIGYVIG